MEKRFKVPVRVSKIVKEFIIKTNGSDTIRPKRDDLLWAIVKTNLVIDERRKIMVNDEESIIYIELLNCNSQPSNVIQGYQGKMNSENRQQVFINVNSRHFLSLAGERKVARHLKIQFTELFHTFMLSAAMANPNQTQIDTLTKFMETYNIHLSKIIKEETLLKSWRRSWRYRWLLSSHRERLEGGPVFCPLIF